MPANVLSLDCVSGRCEHCDETAWDHSDEPARCECTCHFTRTVSPDCHQGKCRVCDGDAWDHAADQPASCSCSCHREEG